jgi:uncharacterized protein YbbC (DUF1343 family)/CubicO group peptidase (beta-lactamase class C family)
MLQLVLLLQSFLSSPSLERVDALVAQAIEAGRCAGCVVAIGCSDGVRFLRAYGRRAVEPTAETMTVDTLFDLASLTKPLVTASSMMLLLERGQLRLDDRVARHWPEFGVHGKESVTLRQLLLHTSGLVADNELEDYRQGGLHARRSLAGQTLTAAPGTTFVYSDVGYLVAAEVVQRVSGRNLDCFAREHLFAPLAMEHTLFNPPADWHPRIAPTAFEAGEHLRGVVHDPRARLLGGVAGHAGLFSTASDLARFCRMLLQEGQLDGNRVLSEACVRAMVRGRAVPGGLRALGWDVKSRFSSNKSDLFGERAFGHGGFTGTGLWVDPDLDLFVVFLSSRLYPQGKGNVNPILARIGSVAAAAVARRPLRRPAAVLNGIDVWLQQGLGLFADRRLGLITNHTGRTLVGQSTAEVLWQAESVQLAALFSPEHGPQGAAEGHLSDAVHPRFGIPIYSLYGEHRRPQPEQLEGLDALVYDIQDIGTRFYTYISTLGQALEAAAQGDLPLVVLDRPNPLGGLVVQGPLLDPGRESFTGWHSLPIRHGMTVGELAQMFLRERNLQVDLQVVPMQGWSRWMRFADTGQTWVNPSPNMRSPHQALLYPGVGLLEFTNLSVGRGTDTPFEIFGAPWLQHRELAQRLASAGLPGVALVPVEFTPQSSVFAGQSCRGIRILLSQASALTPVRLGLEIAAALQALQPGDWQIDRFDQLLVHRATFEGIRAGRPVAELVAAWGPQLAAFRERRQAFLLYR